MPAVMPATMPATMRAARRARVALGVGFTLVAMVPACGVARLDLLFPGEGDDAGTVADAADAALSDGEVVLPADYCSGKGAPILVSDHGASVCTGGMAQAAFRYALCTCDGLVSAKPLVTDSFDSRNG